MQRTSRTGLDRWCDRTWIKVGCAITGAVTIALMLNWYSWSDGLKVVFGVAALIPVHVIEEWVFPGGFHYHYNVLMRSEEPNSTPMCRLSDMVTNFATTIMYLVLGLWCLARGSVPTGLLLATLIFGCLELFAHTLFGVVMYVRFRAAGKTTIYGPGSITAYLGFGPLAVMSLYCLQGCAVGGADWALAVGVLVVIAGGFILLPETLIKRFKRKAYAFDDAGYYQRFL